MAQHEPQQAIEHLGDLVERIDDLARRVEALGRLGAEARVWQPDEGSWSVAHCCEHLSRTADHYHREVEKVLAGAPAAGDGTFRPSRFGRWFVRAAGPEGRPLKAPGSVRPGAADARAVERFAGRLEELRSIITAVADRGLDLQKNRVRTLIPILTTQLGVVLTLLVGHGERHIAQAERVTRADGFPGSG